VEKSAALAAMRDVLDWIVRQRPFPLFVSEYIDVVRDFEDMRIAQVDEDTWRVRNSGYCRTVRFDTWDRHVDLGRSRGVIGYDRASAQQALYVHLDESHDHTLVLTDQPGRRPYLRRAASAVDELRLAQDRVSLVTARHRHQAPDARQPAPESDYRFVASSDDGLELRGSVRTDAEGTLSWIGAINGTRVEVALRAGGRR